MTENLASLVKKNLYLIYIYVSLESLQRYFNRYGEVIDCVVMKNSESGRSRGFGFVTFADPNNVNVVLQNGPHVLDGRTVSDNIVISFINTVETITMQYITIFLIKKSPGHVLGWFFISLAICFCHLGIMI